jgi:methyl-accepting chemotaxis protein
MVDQMSMLGSMAMRPSDAPAHAVAWDLTTTPPWGDADPAEELVELAGAVADMVGGIHRAVLAFSGGGARTAVGTAAVSSRVHHIRTELEGVAIAVEALHSGAEDAALAGAESAQVCTDLAGEVERGTSVLARVVESVEAMQAQRERIERLADQLAEIATFSGVIKEVADKTKLLALNATIEAARAGTHGAAFRVVADEIGRLAADSEAQTRRIATVVAATHSDLEPLRQAIDAGREQGDGVADALEARETLRRIGELAEQLTAPAERVAASAEEQLQSLGEMSGHMQGTVVAVTEVDEHAQTMSGEAIGLSSSAEDVYELLRPFRTDAFVDRADEVGRRLAREIGAVLDDVVDSGRMSLARRSRDRASPPWPACSTSPACRSAASTLPSTRRRTTTSSTSRSWPSTTACWRRTRGSCWLRARTSTSTPRRTPGPCARTGPATRRRTSSATASSASSPTTRPWCAPTASGSAGASCPTGR